MNRFKIGTRLTLGFGLMIVFMAILMAVSLMRMNAGAQATTEITERGMKVEQHSNGCIGHVVRPGLA